MAKLMSAASNVNEREKNIIRVEGNDLIHDSQSQKLPSNLLLTLKQDTSKRGVEKQKDKKLHNVKLPPLGTVTAQTDSSPGNVWHHPKQRQKLKYLANNTQCVCGAGRDISFIYDTSTNSISKSDVPESLIPAEFHVVKHTGVLGLDLYDEAYTSLTDSHDRHLTTFPSMRPSGRHEVLELKNTLDQMIGSIGLADSINNMELKGPTQVHNLIQLIKKEQEIYNICFHELIRQVTVHCSERGALLGEIRQCYSLLLSKIPYQVKSLHDEVIAQRALDRKLTSELVRFHGILTRLTSDLCELRDQNELAGEEVEETKENLLLALSESEKNANLLGEYSHLYELQRHRLEDQIAHLSKERELWEQTCYNLASQVADHHNLQSVRQLQLSAKSWEKLAKHFAIILSEKNTTQLCTLQNEVHVWRRDLAIFFQELKVIEETIVSKLVTIYDDMNCWLDKLHALRDCDNSLEKNEVEQFWQTLIGWLQVLNKLSDMFAGEKLLNRIDQLQLLKDGMSNWSETALSILNRHFEISTSIDSSEKPDNVTNLVNEIEKSIKSLSVRTSGENGIAINFVRLITPLESWDTTFSLVVHGGKVLSESNCGKLMSQMEGWLRHVSATLECLSAVKVQDDKESFDDLLSQVDKWCSAFCHGVQVDDNNVIQHITQLYSSLIQWMAQLLLTLSHNKTTSNNNNNNDDDIELITELQSNYSVICDRLTSITTELSKSCNIIFNEENKENDDKFIKENQIVDEERQQLEILAKESQNWMCLSNILVDSLPTTTSDSASATDHEKEEPLLDEHIVMTIGIDDNVTNAPSDTVMYGEQGSGIKLELHTEQDLPEGRKGQAEELEKLVMEMDELKSQLSTLETKLASEQDRAQAAEKSLKEAHVTIDQLTNELTQAKNEIQEQSVSKKGKNRTRIKSTKDSKT